MSTFEEMLLSDLAPNQPPNVPTVLKNLLANPSTLGGAAAPVGDLMSPGDLFGAPHADSLLHGDSQNITAGQVSIPINPESTRWDEPVKCTMCPRIFATKYQAKKHFLRRHFRGEKKHMCTRCMRKTFAVREDLTMHLKSCGLKFTCSCGLELKSPATLKRHCKQLGHEPQCLDGVPAHGETDVPVDDVPMAQECWQTPSEDLDSAKCFPPAEAPPVQAPAAVAAQAPACMLQLAKALLSKEYLASVPRAAASPSDWDANSYALTNLAPGATSPAYLDDEHGNYAVHESAPSATAVYEAALDTRLVPATEGVVPRDSSSPSTDPSVYEAAPSAEDISEALMQLDRELPPEPEEAEPPAQEPLVEEPGLVRLSSIERVADEMMHTSQTDLWALLTAAC